MVLTFLTIEPFLRWGLSGLLLLIWVAILLKLLRLKSLSPIQRNVKILLNTLLFALAVLFLAQPMWPERRGGEALLVYHTGVPMQSIDSVEAVHKTGRRVSYKEFSRKFREYPHQRFFFFGQAAEPSLVSHLAGKEVHWIPYFAPDALQDLSWQGMRQKGDLQTISGKITISGPGKIKLVYGEKTLDSLSLEKGFNAFSLSFPVFAEGRNVISLQLHGRPLQEVAFYARPARSLNISLLQDNPDFESRILAEWLGAQGHRVEISTPVARSVLFEGRINKPEPKKTPDLVIATPARSADLLVRKAVADGRSVLFWGVDEINDDLSRINRATGTAFSARRISAQENLPLKNGLTAMPYQLNPKPNQRQVASLPVSFQKNGGRVAVSLLNETFPARLSGDTLTYTEIWSTILAALKVPDSVSIPAPLFKDVPAKISLQTGQSTLSPDQDTLSLRASGVNPAKTSGQYIFNTTGWKTLYPAGEVYVEDSPLASVARWKNWLTANQALFEKGKPPGVHPVPATIWFWAFLLCLAVLWIEAKFRY